LVELCGEIMDNAVLNSQIMRMARRVENPPAEVLRDSFVPVASLVAQLQSSEHQILFGRRGTGKTRLIRYLQEQRDAEGALAIYLTCVRSVPRRTCRRCSRNVSPRTPPSCSSM